MEKIELERIRYDGGTQVREKINLEVVEEYAEHIADLPPVVVFFDGKFLWLADGFHRYYAHRTAGAATIDAEVRQGTLRDALLYALGSNRTHGLQRTNADKQKAVNILLADPEWAEWSNVRLAAMAGVDEKTVRSIRGASSEVPSTRRFLRDGDDHEMDTSSIGKKPVSAPTSPEKAPPKLLPAPPAPAPTPPAKPPSDEPARDCTGQIIEDPQIAADFARVGEIDEMLQHLTRFKATVQHGIETQDRLYRLFNAKSIHANATNLYRDLKHGRPYAVCPYCGGRGTSCKACQGLGWVGKSAYEVAPEELRNLK